VTGAIALLGGVLMGLASSLHCAGVCGGIASSLMLVTATPSPTVAARAQAMLAAQFGRAVTYTTFGALVGFGGTAFAGLLELAGAQAALRALAAATLIFSGLSIAGLAPSFAGIDRIVGGAVQRWSAPLRSGRVAPPFALGLAWGLAPCGMVYAALINATLTGSPAGGAAFMAGFGLATAPAVAAAAFGVSVLAGGGLRQRGRARVVLGSALAILGALSLAEPATALTRLCLYG
jgi:sulfite exporter TauE/SafE